MTKREIDKAIYVYGDKRSGYKLRVNLGFTIGTILLTTLKEGYELQRVLREAYYSTLRPSPVSI